MNPSDPQLVRRLKAKDSAAFEEVVERHYQPVYRQLWHLCGDAEVAADLTQETFVQAWKSLPSFAGRSSLRTWISVIAVRVWRRWRQGNERGETVPLEEVAETLPDPALSPAEALDLHCAQEAVHGALLALPAIYREALVLFYLQGLKYHEIAGALDIPLGTVKSRLHGGLLRMRAALERAPDAEGVR
jgi:RNA polymerase sigma-70 factor, ECF subfamily